MPNKYPKVQIIILQYNNAVDTLDCLWSLRNVTYPIFDVAVVDNNSDPEELKKIEEYGKNHVEKFGVKIIRSNTNLGYSGGNNLGIEYALKEGADYILILNNDTVVGSDFLDNLIEFGEKNQGYGVFGPKMNLYRYGPGEDETWFSGADISFLNTNVRHKTNPNNRTGETGYVPGAALCIRREVVEKIGYLDEDYFLYYEDMDYSLRAREAGYSIGYVADSEIWHKVSRTVSALPDTKRLRYVFRNVLFLAKRFGSLKTKLMIPIWMSFVASKQFVKLAVSKDRAVARAILSGLRDYISNRIGSIENPKIKIGMEASDLEGARYGIGKTLIRLTEYLSKNEEARNNYAFYLFFPKEIPNDPILNHPLFRKRLLKVPGVPKSFNIFYHIYVPVAYWYNRLSACLFFPYMLPAFFKGKSVVMLTNDVIYEVKRREMPFKYRLGYGLFSWWAAKRANKIMSISEYAKGIIADAYKINREKIFVNPLGIDNIFDKRPDITDINDTKRKLGIDRFFITFVGQAFPRRRLKETLLAFKKIKKIDDDYQFLFIGTDKYPDSSVQDITKDINEKFGEDTVVYHHRVDENDLKSVYAGTKVLAYISTSEAQGLPPMEALKFGTPALLKDYGLSRELFEDYAFYVRDETNVDEIAVMMEKALGESELKEKIRKEGKRMPGRFTWEQCVEKLIHEIKQLS